MKLRCAWEHNGNDTLLYCIDAVGAYTRGENLDIASGKMKDEINSYFDWLCKPHVGDMEIEIVQQKKSHLCISDADSDIIFDEETKPLAEDEYRILKELALKSARDFHLLYESIADKDVSCLNDRTTFYGRLPRTAREMYEHTKNVNAYYFGEIGIDADNEGTIYECRRRGFELLEETQVFLNAAVIEGSYGEAWSVRKMLRRFLWHDRIHAKAMYRMAIRTFGANGAENIFRFII